MISLTQHPDYMRNRSEYNLWRDILDGGEQFINNHLEKYSSRETELQFNSRKKITYNPAFAKGAITDIKNAIFQRFTDIKRTGGNDFYRQAISGENGGVDKMCSSMNTFVGDSLLEELIGMGKVGVFIYMPKFTGITKADTSNIHPSLSVFKCEDILNWEYEDDGSLKYVILRLQDYERDEEGFIVGYEDKELRLTKTYSQLGEDAKEPHKLGMVPFTIIELTHGLLKDIAKYQVALLNIASSDVNYIKSANFPLYTEQVNQNVQMQKFMKNKDSDPNDEDSDKKGVGTMQGRSYAQGTERPQFIHPSPDPLMASIAKQEKMKEELRQIVALSVSTMKSKQESAESKKQNDEGLESGLASIGTVLEASERRIAKIWMKYEGHKDNVKIHYPERYEIKDIDVLLIRVEKLLKIINKIPLLSVQKRIMEEVIRLLISHNIDENEMLPLITEIYDAKIICVDPDVLRVDAENGVISNEYISKIKHYPKEEFKKASEENIKRLTDIAIAQLAGQPAESNDADADDNGAGSYTNKQAVNGNQNRKKKEKKRGAGKKVELESTDTKKEQNNENNKKKNSEKQTRTFKTK